MSDRNRLLQVFAFIFVALLLRFFVADRLLVADSWCVQALAIFIIFALGMGYVFNGTVKVVEETTDVLKDRTGLAGGLLQALGTAFPDMIVGILAAIVSLRVRESDYVRAINLAIVAASATFGSNIYNIIHAAWCVGRQNLADRLEKSVPMFPGIRLAGRVKPLSQHKVKPSAAEIDNAISILTALTLLTAFVAVTMVLFGSVPRDPRLGAGGDLYQLIRPVGLVLFLLCAGVLYHFRKSERSESMDREVVKAESYYAKRPTARIWLDLLLAGLAILFTAEGMVSAIEVFSHLTNMPFVISGILAGFIGCFGEMMVVHNFSVNPNGRISDAISGVAMDNIFTTMAASIVAIMGGIFLGGNALILIFIIILAGNTVLIADIARLRNKL